MREADKVLLNIADKYAKYADAITGFAILQMIAFLFLLLKDEVVREVVANPLGLAAILVAMSLVVGVYIYGIGRCRAKQLELLKAALKTDLDSEIEPALGSVARLQFWAIVVSQGICAIGVVFHFATHG